MEKQGEGAKETERWRDEEGRSLPLWWTPQDGGGNKEIKEAKQGGGAKSETVEGSSSEPQLFFRGSNLFVFFTVFIGSPFYFEVPQGSHNANFTTERIMEVFLQH